MAFIRRYGQDPGLDELRKIEGVVILSMPVPESIQPIGSGTVLLVGEYEDGGFAVDPIAPSNNNDLPGGVQVLSTNWEEVGGFGYQIDGEPFKFACSQKGNDELWNGNAYVQAKGLGFGRLMAARVDSSAGQVTFFKPRQLTVSGAGPWTIADGDDLELKVGSTTYTITFGAGVLSVTRNDLITKIEAVATGLFSVNIVSSTAMVITCHQNDVVETLATSTGIGPSELPFTAGEWTAPVGLSTPTAIYAGTLVGPSSSPRKFAVMQTKRLYAGDTSVTIRVRHAIDDQTGTEQAIRGVDSVGFGTIPSGWIVSNAALIKSGVNTEAAKDAAYVDAIRATKSISTEAKKVSYIVSARQSKLIRDELLANALEASAGGCYGRKARISPPVNTTLQDAQDSDVGVVDTLNSASYRDERCCYALGFRKYIEELVRVGPSGGVGYVISGEIPVHGDIVLASIESRLPAEESAAQLTGFIPKIYRGVWSSMSQWDILSYVDAKASGLCSPIYDSDTGLQFQTHCTTVDPLLNPGRVGPNRVAMEDFLSDSISLFQKKYVGTLPTPERVDTLVATMKAFLDRLATQDSPRIKSFYVNKIFSKGRVAYINWGAELFAPMDVIVNKVNVYESAGG